MGSRGHFDHAGGRLQRPQHVAEVVSSWSMASVAEAYQALRGDPFRTAVTFVAEIGMWRRSTPCVS